MAVEATLDDDAGKNRDAIDIALDIAKDTHIYIYYRFIVRFPIVLDFLFITFTFLFYLLLSWTSSLSISSSAISASTL